MLGLGFGIPKWGPIRSDNQGFWYTPGLHIPVHDGTGNANPYTGVATFTGGTTNGENTEAYIKYASHEANNFNMGSWFKETDNVFIGPDWGNGPLVDSGQYSRAGGNVGTLAVQAGTSSSNVSGGKLIGWYKHNTGIQTATVGGVENCVTQWNDQSGMGNHLVVSDSDGNGQIQAHEHPKLQDDGSVGLTQSNEHLTFTSALNLDGYHIFIRMSTSNYGDFIFENDAGNEFIKLHSANEWRINYGSDRRDYYPFGSGSSNVTPVNGTTAGQNVFTVDFFRSYADGSGTLGAGGMYPGFNGTNFATGRARELGGSIFNDTGIHSWDTGSHMYAPPITANDGVGFKTFSGSNASRYPFSSGNNNTTGGRTTSSNDGDYYEPTYPQIMEADDGATLTGNTLNLTRLGNPAAECHIYEILIYDGCMDYLALFERSFGGLTDTTNHVRTAAGNAGIYPRLGVRSAIYGYLNLIADADYVAP